MNFYCAQPTEEKRSLLLLQVPMQEAVEAEGMVSNSDAFTCAACFLTLAVCIYC